MSCRGTSILGSFRTLSLYPNSNFKEFELGIRIFIFIQNLFLIVLILKERIILNIDLTSFPNSKT